MDRRLYPVLQYSKTPALRPLHHEGHEGKARRTRRNTLNCRGNPLWLPPQTDFSVASRLRNDKAEFVILRLDRRIQQKNTNWILGSSRRLTFPWRKKWRNALRCVRLLCTAMTEHGLPSFDAGCWPSDIQHSSFQISISYI